MKLTLTECSIIISIIVIIVALISSPGGLYDDTICKAGYVFVKSYDGPDIQVINENGTGIKCN